MPPPDRPSRSWELWDVPAALALILGALALVALDAPVLLRAPVGLAALFLAPGYSLAGALFPRRPRGEAAIDIDSGPGSPMSAAMRFGLAIALSTALLVLAAIAVEAAGPLRPLRVLGVLAAVTALATLAWARRTARAPSPLARPVAQPPGPEGPRESPLLGTLLVAAMVIAALAMGYALLKPRDSPEFTTLYLKADDGDQHCFPDRYLQGAYGIDPREADDCADVTPGSLVLGINNFEGRPMDYWLRTVWTNEVLAEDNLTDILQAQVIQSWQVSLDPVDPPDDPALHEPQYELPFELPAPPGNGTWRWSVQLYTGQPPPLAESRSSMESPYKRLHLMIQVS